MEAVFKMLGFDPAEIKKQVETTVAEFKTLAGVLDTRLTAIDKKLDQLLGEQINDKRDTGAGGSHIANTTIVCRTNGEGKN